MVAAGFVQYVRRMRTVFTVALVAGGCRSHRVGESMIPLTVVILAQSNGSGVTGPSPYLLEDQRARGARVVDNGEDLASYPAAVGPEPWLVDELLLLGYSPTVVIRANPNLSLESILTNQVPLLAADLLDGVASGIVPDVVLLWQGEADARNEPGARLYENRLVGPWGEKGDGSLRDQLRLLWPLSQLLIVELRVRDYDYAQWHAPVRAAQHRAGTLPGVCLIPTYDAPLMPGQNQPHVSVEGLEVVGRRAAHAAVAVIGGERCP